MARDNRTQIFSELVSLSAWHEEFSEDNKKVSLHADVVFSEAPMGGDAASKITFRLSVRRAELVVYVPETEPAIIDPRGVERFIKKSTLQREKTTEKSKSHTRKLSGSTGVENKKINMKAAADAAVQADGKTTETLRESEDLTSFAIKQKVTPDSQYVWELKDVTDGHPLNDRPWDPDTTPLVKVAATNQKNGKIPPIVRIEVKCRREDLIIEDIEIKNPPKGKLFSKRQGNDERMKAAEAFIRNRLTEEGLSYGDLSEEFSTISLASIEAQALPRD